MGNRFKVVFIEKGMFELVWEKKKKKKKTSRKQRITEQTGLAKKHL